MVVQQARKSKNPNVAAGDIEVYFPIAQGNTTAGRGDGITLYDQVSGDVETSPVNGHG